MLLCTSTSNDYALMCMHRRYTVIRYKVYSLCVYFFVYVCVCVCVCNTDFSKEAKI